MKKYILFAFSAFLLTANTFAASDVSIQVEMDDAADVDDAEILQLLEEDTASDAAASQGWGATVSNLLSGLGASMTVKKTGVFLAGVASVYYKVWGFSLPCASRGSTKAKGQ